MARPIESKIFAPHSDIQEQMMMFLAGKGPPYIQWVACGTKFGKTLGACGGMAHAAPKISHSTWRIVAPIYRQTKISWKYMSQLWPGDPYTAKNKSEMTMRIPDQDVELQFWHGQNPEDLEGEGITGQINDECAKLKAQIMASTRTTTTMTQGRVQNISTPRGRNWFYKGCMRAKEEMERAASEGRLPRETFLWAPTKANPHVPRESIIEAKRLLPDRLFRQYYEAEFVEDGMVFSTLTRDPMWKEKFRADGPIEYWIHPNSKNIQIVAGMDWAKKRDFSVLTCWDYAEKPFRMVGFLRFQGHKYTDQVVEVARFLQKFKHVEVMYHDKTGVGEAVDDLLGSVPNLVYKGFIFTNASKAYLVNDTIKLIEKRDVLWPWWDKLHEEFENFEVETTDLGNMTYAASEGSHDDIVASCCLGLRACEEYTDKSSSIVFLEELVGTDEYKDHWDEYLEEMLGIDLKEGF